MSLPGGGVLVVTIGSTPGRRTSGASRASSASSVSPSRGGKRAPAWRGGVRGGGERLRRARQHELARGEVVVGAGVDPEQLRVALDLGERRGVDAGGVRENRLEHVAHLEVVRVALVVEDVAPGDAPPGTGARRASSPSAAVRRSRRRTAARPPRRRPVRAGTSARSAAAARRRRFQAAQASCRPQAAIADIDKRILFMYRQYLSNGQFISPPVRGVARRAPATGAPLTIRVRSASSATGSPCTR